MDMAANTSDSVALLSQTQIYTQERFITLAPSTTGEGGGGDRMELRKPK